MIDLHVHSNKSDGSYTPSDLISLALEKKLSAIALTDHDTTDGLREFRDSAKSKPIEAIPGIELSTEYEGKDIHIVGLFIDETQPDFQKHLQNFVASRETRNQKMCANLQAAGLNISYEALKKEYPESVITRAHYGTYLVKTGACKSVADAFSQYLGDHTRYFVPREKVTPAEAVILIRKAGGIPVLAHPILYHMSADRLEQLVKTLITVGLMGIEAIYSTYSAREENQIRRLADKYHLLLSGGSDFHGAAKPKLSLGTGYGNLAVPDEILWEMKSRIPQ